MWWMILGILLMYSGCVGQPPLPSAVNPPCLPAQITMAQLTGEVVASAALRPGLSSVRVRTPRGEVVTYWSGEAMIAIDLEPDNRSAPLWQRSLGEVCQWHYGREA